MLQAENRLTLAGTISDTPVISHKTHNFTFMRFTLRVLRLSKTEDFITVLSDLSTVNALNLKAGDFIEINGELRSYNNKTGVGNKLIIFAFAQKITKCETEHKNELFLCGAVCKAPIYRKTPLGREICDVMLAVNRRYGRADYLPCIAWGKNAQNLACFSVGDSLSITGRIQSREYIKTIDGESHVRTTYEVSITDLDLL